jgi:hypothetical protein
VSKSSLLDRPDKPDRTRETAKRDRTPKTVEMVLESPTGRFVIEHTRIECLPRQIEDGHRFATLLEPIESGINPIRSTSLKPTVGWRGSSG